MLRSESINLASWVIEHIRRENIMWHGTKVKLLTGKYEGREALIEGVIPDEKHGLLFLCMVQRADDKGSLNTDTESRLYRPISEFREL